MNVCLIQNTIAPYRIPLFQNIAKTAGIDFTLLLMAEEKPDYPQWKQFLKNLSFSTRIIPGMRLRLKPGSQICINPALLTYLLQQKPEVVFCCGFTFSTFWVILYKILAGKKAVVWMEGNAITESFRSNKFIRQLYRKIIARLVDGFIDAGKLSREYVESLLPAKHSKKFFRSYNCIDSNFFMDVCNNFKRNKKEYNAFAKRFPQKNILFSGRLNEIKNIKLMIDVYEKFLKRFPEPVGLIVLGQGNLKNFLETRKKQKKLKYLFIEGFKQNDEYIKYFTVSDLFLLLSKYDCNPLVIFEALSAGLPVVCSDKVGNAVDFIEDGQNGYIVDPYNIDTVVEKICDILSHKNSEKMRNVSLKQLKKANYCDSARGFVNAVKFFTS